jgi:putative transposase
VPPAQELSEAQLLERIQAGYGPARRQALDQELARLRQEPAGAEQIQRRLQPYRRRMFDLSIFIKELKGRFAQWYNRRHGRYGRVLVLAERLRNDGVDVQLDQYDLRPLWPTPRKALL